VGTLHGHREDAERCLCLDFHRDSDRHRRVGTQLGWPSSGRMGYRRGCGAVHDHGGRQRHAGLVLGRRDVR
jgi:hypothetical protein